MIIAKIEEQHTKQPTRKGKLEPTTFFYHAIKCTFIIQYTHIQYTSITQACYDPSINTLRLDSSGYI